MKKLLCLLMTLTMALGLMLPAALAAETDTKSSTAPSLISQYTPKFDSLTMTEDSFTVPLLGTCPLCVDAIDTEGDVIKPYPCMFRWTVGDPSVVSLIWGGDGSDYAVAYGTKPGTTTVTCSLTLDGVTRSVSCTITVLDNPTGLFTYVETDPRITIDSRDNDPDPNEDGQVPNYLFASPNQGAPKDIEYHWDSENPDIATANSEELNVFVKSVAPGTTTVTCTATCQGVSRSTTCLVKVEGSFGKLAITKDLPQDFSTTQGNHDKLQIMVENNSDYDLCYQWYVDRRKDNSSHSDTFDTAHLSTGIHVVTCTVSTSQNGYSEDSTICFVNVTDASGFGLSSDLPDQAGGPSGSTFTVDFTVKNPENLPLTYHWYVDGVETDAYSRENVIDIKNMPVGNHEVFCVVSTSDGKHTATTQTSVLTVTSPGGYYSTANFVSVREYENRFRDVSQDSWFYPYVKGAYELGLVDGKNSDQTFCPDDSITVAEALKIAARMKNIQNNVPSAYFDNMEPSSPWYSNYVAFCQNIGLIKEGEFTDFDAPCTRSQMARIFSDCIPLESVRDVKIPDCDSSTPYFKEIQNLYNAGVLSGDQNHNFHPGDAIRRSEVAKIIAALTSPALRDKSSF